MTLRYLLLIIQAFTFAQTQRRSFFVMETNVGKIRGFTFDDSDHYLGVPYALPPTNERRFKAPVSSSNLWEGTLNATIYPSACFQQDGVLVRNFAQNPSTTDDAILQDVLPSDEDCLYINIFTPAGSWDDDVPLPVMVFIHGGGFISGTGSAFKGSVLSKYGLVIVTLNYRLGPFGFLSNGTTDFEGNYGIQDQKAAVQWVKENIHSFGGNPNAITIFGEEAGGSSVHLHLMTSTTGTFHNAIIQSAQYDDGVYTEKQCKDQFKEFVSTVNGIDSSNSSELLRKLPASNILSNSQTMTMNNWRPCIYSDVISNSPQNLLQQSNFTTDINVLVGSNTGAGIDNGFGITGDINWLYNATKYIVNEAFPQLYGSVTTDEINRMSKNYYQFYATLGIDVSILPEDFIRNAYGDQIYRTWAQEISRETDKKCNCSVYEYIFDIDSQGLGAPLSAELPYIFGYANNSLTLTESLLASSIRLYWTNFAKTGDPNSAQVQDWLKYDSTSETEGQCHNALLLTSTIKTTTDDVTSRSWEFWSSYYDNLGFSCFSKNPDEENPTDMTKEPTCEPSVEDAIGIPVTNEEAAIMLICFITFTGVFLISTIAATCGCCFYKKRVKKLKKRMKKERDGHDNPVSLEYKL